MHIFSHNCDFICSLLEVRKMSQFNYQRTRIIFLNQRTHRFSSLKGRNKHRLSNKNDIILRACFMQIIIQ